MLSDCANSLHWGDLCLIPYFPLRLLHHLHREMGFLPGLKFKKHCISKRTKGWFLSYEHWKTFAAAAAKSLQSCPTLCDPTDGSPPGSPIPGILQARTLEWVATSSSNAWKWKVKGKSLSRVRLFLTPRTAAYEAPLPMGFSRQEY